jgi:hypothetical protein
VVCIRGGCLAIFIGFSLSECFSSDIFVPKSFLLRVVRQGSIPTEIGLLSNLTSLKLSYNRFVGDGANFGGLSRLRLIHLHGNRLSGGIPPMKFKSSSSSSYIADCGNPSDFKRSLLCEECTMCCKPFLPFSCCVPITCETQINQDSRVLSYISFQATTMDIVIRRKTPLYSKLDSRITGSSPGSSLR